MILSLGVSDKRVACDYRYKYKFIESLSLCTGKPAELDFSTEFISHKCNCKEFWKYKKYYSNLLLYDDFF